MGLGSLERVELVARLENAASAAAWTTAAWRSTPPPTWPALLAGAAPAAARRARPPAEAPPAGGSRRAAPAATLHDTLWQRAERQPQRPQVFLREDDGRELVVSYGLLLAEAGAWPAACASWACAAATRWR